MFLVDAGSAACEDKCTIHFRLSLRTPIRESGTHRNWRSEGNNASKMDDGYTWPPDGRRHALLSFSLYLFYSARFSRYHHLFLPPDITRSGLEPARAHTCPSLMPRSECRYACTSGTRGS